MLATIHDDTWNVLNMQLITLNWKRCYYSDIPGGGTFKGPGLILGLRPANEIRRYKVTPSLIGWVQT